MYILLNFMFSGWNRWECLKTYQKVISRSLIALNFIKLCGIMMHFPKYAGLCEEGEIMRFRIHHWHGFAMSKAKCHWHGDMPLTCRRYVKAKCHWHGNMRVQMDFIFTGNWPVWDDSRDVGGQDHILVCGTQGNGEVYWGCTFCRLVIIWLRFRSLNNLLIH